MFGEGGRLGSTLQIQTGRGGKHRCFYTVVIAKWIGQEIVSEAGVCDKVIVRGVTRKSTLSRGGSPLLNLRCKQLHLILFGRC